MPHYLTRHKAADYVTGKGLRITKNQLQKLASTGGGPPYQLFGNSAVYTPSNLDAWVEEKLGPLRASTSDLVEPDAA